MSLYLDEDVERAAKVIVRHYDFPWDFNTALIWQDVTGDARYVLATIGPIIERQRQQAIVATLRTAADELRQAGHRSAAEILIDAVGQVGAGEQQPPRCHTCCTPVSVTGDQCEPCRDSR